MPNTIADRKIRAARLRASVLSLVFVLTLAACEKKASEQAAAPTQEAAPQSAPNPAVPSGAEKKISQLEGDQLAAYVTDIAHLKDGGKIYSTAGGDPAINGLYTYIASPIDPAEGVRVFQIGDFNSWKLSEDRGKEVVLEVSRSWVDDKGDIQTAEELLIVSTPTNETAEVTVTPAKR